MYIIVVPLQSKFTFKNLLEFIVAGLVMSTEEEAPLASKNKKPHRLLDEVVPLSPVMIILSSLLQHSYHILCDTLWREESARSSRVPPSKSKRIVEKNTDQMSVAKEKISSLYYSVSEEKSIFFRT